MDGIDLAYRVIGDGEPLIMLHGFSGTAAMWEPLFDIRSFKAMGSSTGGMTLLRMATTQPDL